ncbi:MAG: branched-chain amino acid aminotransferase [Proteobacteria bacterium]|nr:branched-chain amino acid aminotransferase [Pseudomonadota bacterium]
MEIKTTTVPSDQLKPKPKDSELAFGNIFTDHMFMLDYHAGQGWHDPRVVPYGPLVLDPATAVLHYAQEIFEGLKCYRRTDGGLQLFRVRDNFRRMNESARRMCIPELDIDLVVEGLKTLLRVERDWVPGTQGTSLYIRPTIIATEAFLGVRPAAQYLYYVILGPVGAYYKEGFNPIKILVEEKYVRAVRGGVGSTKTGGNYAASLYAAEEAHKKGFTQVLWLDAIERKYVEEVGTMNMLFLIDDELVVPPLGGSILPGITRYTVLDLVREWGGYRVSERHIAIDEVMDAARNGRLKEAFGAGTAAVISPVGWIVYKGEEVEVAGGKTGPLAQKLYDEITSIQYGTKPDVHGWIETV